MGPAGATLRRCGAWWGPGDVADNRAPCICPAPPLPANRPRRLRRDAFTRNLVREHRLSAHDFIYPVFVHEGENRREAVPSMPGVERLSLDLLLPVAAECVQLGIPYLALFPAIDAALKTPDGKEALNPDGLIPRVVRRLKAEFPQLGVMTDVALDPTPATARMACWTRPATSSTTRPWKSSSARPGARRRGRGHGGAQRHDGRAHWRHPRRAGGPRPIHTRIMAYSAKYASSFYGPFRDAVGTRGAWAKADKSVYQMDPPTPTKRCAKWRWIWPKARTWSWSSPACPTWTWCAA